jgi:Skp family chaperone for outer membrane proteins
MKKRKKTLLLCSLMGGLLLLSAQAPVSTAPKIAIVSFKACAEGSKLGKQEQAKLKEMEKQMQTTYNSREKELSEMEAKLKPEFLDTLTPEKENELRENYDVAVHELSQLQGQYYHLLNQANNQLIQNLNENISQAAAQVAKAKGYDLVLTSEACFFYNEQNFDISKLVIEEMDKKPVQKPIQEEKKLP